MVSMLALATIALTAPVVLGQFTYICNQYVYATNGDKTAQCNAHNQVCYPPACPVPKPDPQPMKPCGSCASCQSWCNLQGRKFAMCVTQPLAQSQPYITKLPCGQLYACNCKSSKADMSLSCKNCNVHCRKLGFASGSCAGNGNWNCQCKWVRALTVGERTVVQDEHNSRRISLAKGAVTVMQGRGPSGKGFKMPEAANMFKMVYDVGLENLARKWLSACNENRSEIDTNSEVATLVNVVKGNQIGKPVKLLKNSLTTWWSHTKYYKFVPDHNTGIGGKPFFPWEVYQSPTKNYPASFMQADLARPFMQMAWQRSKRVGCAIGICKGASQTLCAYHENILKYKTEPPYVQGKPCTRCGGAKCGGSKVLCVA